MMIKPSSVEQSVYQVDRLVFFLVDNLGIHLGHLHIGMAEQLRGRVKVSPEGKQCGRKIAC